MKAKITRGSRAKDLEEYLCKEGSEFVCGSVRPNMERQRAKYGIIDSVTSLNDKITRPIWHCSLSLPEGEKLDKDKWEQVVERFFDLIEIDKESHLWFCVRHRDTKYDHVHIALNRIRLDGRVWLGQFDLNKAIKATQIIEREFGLIQTPGMKGRKGGRISDGAIHESKKGIEIEKAYVRSALEQILKQKEPMEINRFVRECEIAGIIPIPNLSKTKKMNGFSFWRGQYQFKGSQLGKAFKWNRLSQFVLYVPDRHYEFLREFGSRSKEDKEQFVSLKSKNREEKNKMQKKESETPKTNSMSRPGAREKFKMKARLKKQMQKQTQWVEKRVIEETKKINPIPFLESFGAKIEHHGKHYVVLLGKEEYRLTKNEEGKWLWCDKYASRGGDNLSFFNEIRNLSLSETVKLLSEKAGTSVGERHQTPGIVAQRYRPVIPPPDAVKRDAGRAYLRRRGITQRVIEDAEAQGALAYGTGEVFFVGRDEERVLRSATSRAYFEGAKKPKRDVAGSDKTYPTILRGRPETIWIVEGGVDGLALWTAADRARTPRPTVIVSGGIGIKKWTKNKQVQEILGNAKAVFFARDREEDEKKQEQINKIANRTKLQIMPLLQGAKFVEWWPPQGYKDLADYNLAIRERFGVDERRENEGKRKGDIFFAGQPDMRKLLESDDQDLSVRNTGKGDIFYQFDMPPAERKDMGSESRISRPDQSDGPILQPLPPSGRSVDR